MASVRPISFPWKGSCVHGHQFALPVPDFGDGRDEDWNEGNLCCRPEQSHNYVAMQVAGFEKTFFNGTATFGLQVPNLWVTNLTAAGTSEFSVPGQSSAGLDPQDLTFGDLTLIAKYAFLNGVDANSDRNLFVTQGTQVTTSEILVPGVTALNPTNMFAFGGLVLLDGTDANGHRNLLNRTAPPPAHLRSRFPESPRSTRAILPR